MELKTDVEKDFEQRLEALRVFAERYTDHGIKRFLKKIYHGKVRYDKKTDQLNIRD